MKNKTKWQTKPLHEKICSVLSLLSIAAILVAGVLAILGIITNITAFIYPIFAVYWLAEAGCSWNYDKLFTALHIVAALFFLGCYFF